MEVKTAPLTEGQEVDFLPIRRIDHIHFWVGNARQAAEYYRHCFGFDLVAYSGLETGNRDYASYVLEQGAIRFVLSTPYGPEGEMADHIRLHGDGVKDVALLVDDAEMSFEETVKRGATPVREPYTVEDENGTVKLASIATYGDTIHTFVERGDYRGPFLPGFVEVNKPGGGVGLRGIDHVVGNVELGKMNYWVDFYAKVMGFSLYIHFDDKDISTEYSALMSKVMSDGQGKIKFPINEPAQGRRKSQIQEYLDYYYGPGVQHIAMLTNDIVATVSELRERGVEFLRVPHAYYEELPNRVGKIDEAIADLERLGILVDRDDEGYLLQIFTRPVQDRPTLFYEVIQRKGARGFGKGNFKALFEAIEREQARRGNL